MVEGVTGKCFTPSQGVTERSFTADLSSGELLVKVAAAGVSSSDVPTEDSRLKDQVSGREFAGVVVDGDEEFMGARVMGFVSQGGFSQYLTVPSQSVSLIPPGMSWEQAATLGNPFVTAYEAIVTRCRTKEGDVVVVQGAMSALGAATLQIAKARGAITVALALKDLGQIPFADYVAVSKGLDAQSLRREVFKFTNKSSGNGSKDALDERGVDVFVDTIGCPSLALGMLKNGGRLAFIAKPRLESKVNLDLVDFFERQISMVAVNAADMSDEYAANVVAKLVPLFEAGQLKPLPINPTRYTLQEVPRAFTAVSRATRTRVVVLPWGADDAGDSIFV